MARPAAGGAGPPLRIGAARIARASACARCVWALREYPASTEAQALLRELGEKSGVTLRIYCRQVSPGEEDRIIDSAMEKSSAAAAL